MAYNPAGAVTQLELMCTVPFHNNSRQSTDIYDHVFVYDASVCPDPNMCMWVSFDATLCTGA